MKQVTHAYVWMAAALCAVAMWAAPVAAAEPGFETAEYAKLPVLLGGRVQPMDSVARNALLQIRGKQTVLLEGRKSMPAIEWLMETMMVPERANTRKAFRIDHPEVLSLFNLPLEEKYFSYDQLSGSLDNFDKEAERVSAIEDAHRTTFEKGVMRLSQALSLYRRLKNTLQWEGEQDFAATVAKYQEALAPALAAFEAQRAGKEFKREDLEALMPFLKQFEFVERAAYGMLVPPLEPNQSREAWHTMGAALLEPVGGHVTNLHPAVMAYAKMSTAFRKGQVQAFNEALAGYRTWLADKKLTREINKGRWEFVYNQAQLFYRSTLLFVFAFICGCVFWVNQSQRLRKLGYALTLIAFVLHTTGLVFRMVLEGRPPVTNLYSSAIFVGWGAVLLGLILERFYRDGIGIVTASAVGFTTLIIAHNLALGGDTMEMLRAVLDTNFWLATHVITITLGYSAAFVAGFLAVVYILRGVLTSSLTEATAKSMHRMVYGIICFATLFSFIGTVLGGIWADQSWGRFWGWDPKENGALLLVLWTAAYLHVRWGGLLSQQGLMNMAVFSNVVTAFSWFGVNMLGVGLHSYGFMDAAFKWLMLFVVSQLAVIGIGMIPVRYWKSFRKQPTERPTTVPA